MDECGGLSENGFARNSSNIVRNGEEREKKVCWQVELDRGNAHVNVKSRKVVTYAHQEKEAESQLGGVAR